MPVASDFENCSRHQPEMAGAKTVGNAQLTVRERCLAAAGAALVAAVVVNPLDVVKVCNRWSTQHASRLTATHTKNIVSNKARASVIR